MKTKENNLVKYRHCCHLYYYPVPHSGGVHSYLDYYQTYASRTSTVLMRQGFIEQTHTALCFRNEVIAGQEKSKGSITLLPTANVIWTNKL